MDVWGAGGKAGYVVQHRKTQAHLRNIRSELSTTKKKRAKEKEWKKEVVNEMERRRT